MNYFNISEIRFLSVDFRGHVGLHLISETLKFQCDHHYFASPFLSSDSAKKSKFWQFLGEFSWWKRPNIRDLKLDIFWKLCSKSVLFFKFKIFFCLQARVLWNTLCLFIRFSFLLLCDFCMKLGYLTLKEPNILVKKCLALVILDQMGPNWVQNTVFQVLWKIDVCNFLFLAWNYSNVKS